MTATNVRGVNVSPASAKTRGWERIARVTRTPHEVMQSRTASGVSGATNPQPTPLSILKARRSRLPEGGKAL